MGPEPEKNEVPESEYSGSASNSTRLLCGGMTPEQFCYWLNGFGELTNEPPTPEQWKAIKEHLQTVFSKVTPPSPGTIPTSPMWDWPNTLPAITC